MDAILTSIHGGKMTKVVSSREVEFTSPTPYQVVSILDRLVENNPNCFIFGYEKDGRTFVGASPEILVRHRGDEILSYALAGTAPKFGPKAWTKEQFLGDHKNRVEHEIVRDRIVYTMRQVTRGLWSCRGCIIYGRLLLPKIVRNRSLSGDSYCILPLPLVVNQERRLWTY